MSCNHFIESLAEETLPLTEEEAPPLTEEKGLPPTCKRDAPSAAEDDRVRAATPVEGFFFNLFILSF